MKNIVQYLRNFNKYRYLLKLLVKKNLERKYKGSILGIAWSLINPLLYMIVLTIIFSTIFKRSIVNFPLYMITGRLIFDFFSAGTNGTMKSIINSSSLIKKVYFPKYLIPLSFVISNFIIFCISFIDLVLVMLVTKAKFTLSLLFIPYYLIILFVFVLGVSLMLSCALVFFRDIEHLYSVFLMILMYFSAIFYPADIVPEKYVLLLNLNPLYQFIKGFRAMIYYGHFPDPTNILVSSCIAIVSLVIGLVVFLKNQDKFVLNI